MARGPYREVAVVIAEESGEEECAAIEGDEEIGPVVVVAGNAASALQWEVPGVVRVVAACAGLGLLVILGMVAFAGP